MKNLSKIIIICLLGIAASKNNLNSQVQEIFRVKYNETNNDAGKKLVLDNSGNIFVSGQVGPRISTAKYDAAGTLVWRKKFSGIAGEDNVAGIELDTQNNCYIGGYTEGAFGVFYFLLVKYNPATGDSIFVKVRTDQSQAFDFCKDNLDNFYIAGDHLKPSVSTQYKFNIVKYNSNGDTLWSRLFTAQNSAALRSIITDQQGNVYATGDVFSTSGFLCTTVKYNSAGTLEWSSNGSMFVGGPSPLGKELIELDEQGNTYIAGYRYFANSFREDIIVVKYSPTGTLLWEKRFEQNNRNDIIGSMIIDNNGDVIISGHSYNPATGMDDLLLLKYDAAGNPLWNKTLTRTNYRFIATTLTCDNQNNVYIAGGSSEGFIVKYSPAGDTLWTQYIKGSFNDGNQLVNDLKLDSDGNIYVTGSIRTAVNDHDMFLIKYSQTTVGIYQLNESASQFLLEQNYPNPFNPVTKIKFGIPNTAANDIVKLTIYNSLGLEVKTLVNKKLSAGNYEFEFDSEGLSSGVYFYKLQSGSFSEIRKMMLVK